VAQSALAHNQELLMGCRRFRFDAAPRFDAGERGGEPAPGQPTATRMLAPGARTPQSTKPALVERLADAEGDRIEIPEGEVWIGSDPQQSAIVLRDPYLDPRHAKIFREEKGPWQIKDNHSRNGVWVGIREIQIWDIAEFLLGEQRILIKVL